MTRQTPLGHSISAHYLLGWCSLCPGRTTAEEACGWQVWAAQLPEVAAEIRRQWEGRETSEDRHHVTQAERHA